MRSLIKTMCEWRAHRPALFLLRHPSLRKNIQLRANPYFVTEVVAAHRLGVRPRSDPL